MHKIIETDFGYAAAAQQIKCSNNDDFFNEFTDFGGEKIKPFFYN